MTSVIDLNCDMGESYGRWTLGADEAIMPYITSANIACGFHGGDPHVIRKTVALALQHKVALGAHPSLPDLMGFGRRVMDVTPAELRDYVCYQTGAVREFARAAGTDLQHVKPHGILYTMAEQQEGIAEAIGLAARDSGSGLILMTLASGKYDAHCRKMGIRVASEGFADRAYEVDGTLVSRRKPGGWRPRARCARSTASTSTSRSRRSAATGTRRGRSGSCGRCARASTPPGSASGR